MSKPVLPWAISIATIGPANWSMTAEIKKDSNKSVEVEMLVRIKETRVRSTATGNVKSSSTTPDSQTNALVETVLNTISQRFSASATVSDASAPGVDGFDPVENPQDAKATLERLLDDARQESSRQADAIANLERLLADARQESSRLRDAHDQSQRDLKEIRSTHHAAQRSTGELQMLQSELDLRRKDLQRVRYALERSPVSVSEDTDLSRAVDQLVDICSQQQRSLDDRGELSGKAVSTAPKEAIHDDDNLVPDGYRVVDVLTSYRKFFDDHDLTVPLSRAPSSGVAVIPKFGGMTLSGDSHDQTSEDRFDLYAPLQLDRQLEEAHAHLASAVDRASKLQREAQAFDEERTRLRDELSKVQEQARNAQRASQEASNAQKQRIADLEADIAKVTHEYQSSISMHADVQDQIAKMEASCLSATQERDAALATIASLEKQCASLKQQRSEQAAAMAQLAAAGPEAASSEADQAAIVATVPQSDDNEESDSSLDPDVPHEEPEAPPKKPDPTSAVHNHRSLMPPHQPTLQNSLSRPSIVTAPSSSATPAAKNPEALSYSHAKEGHDFQMLTPPQSLPDAVGRYLRNGGMILMRAVGLTPHISEVSTLPNPQDAIELEYVRKLYELTNVLMQPTSVDDRSPVGQNILLSGLARARLALGSDNLAHKREAWNDSASGAALFFVCAYAMLDQVSRHPIEES